MDNETLIRIFTAHNLRTRSETLEGAVVVPFMMAKEMMSLGIWDKIKDRVYVSLPLKATSLPSPIGHVSKYGLKHRRGSATVGQGSGRTKGR
jgi:hypothetical protein